MDKENQKCRKHSVYGNSRNIVDAKHHIVLCPLKRNDVDLRSNDVASKLANDVVSLRTQTQKERHDENRVFLFGTDTQNGTGLKT